MLLFLLGLENIDDIVRIFVAILSVFFAMLFGVDFSLFLFELICFLVGIVLAELALGSLEALAADAIRLGLAGGGGI